MLDSNRNCCATTTTGWRHEAQVKDIPRGGAHAKRIWCSARSAGVNPRCVASVPSLTVQVRVRHSPAGEKPAFGPAAALPAGGGGGRTCASRSRARGGGGGGGGGGRARARAHTHTRATAGRVGARSTRVDPRSSLRPPLHPSDEVHGTAASARGHAHRTVGHEQRRIVHHARSHVLAVEREQRIAGTQPRSLGG